MNKAEKMLMPLGMVGVVAYLIHTVLGNILWKDYNPVTTDISSLTAVGAPDRKLLMIFTTIYGFAVILFIIGMIIKSFRKYKNGVRVGWIVFLVMNLISLFGYSAFPLSENKEQMNFQNTMHIIVTIAVVFTTIAAGFILAYSYLKQEKNKKLGKFSLVMAVIIFITGALNPIGMANNLNILGLTERASIYSLQLMTFVFSAYYTFSHKEKI